MERAGLLTAPRENITVTPFCVESINCEEITPELAHNPGYAILYAHGGGYVTGNLNYARILGAKLALSTGFTTFSFDYRLAPEHPYPAALEDAVKVFEYLTGLYPPERILFAGDSAGGNLVLCLAQKLLAEGKKLPDMLLLFSPWTDMTATAPSYETYKNMDPILTKEYVTEAAKVYIAGQGSDDDPRFSPLSGTLSGLPHVYIMAGRNEILLDDSLRLRDKILELDGDVTLDLDEDGWHVYQQMPLPIAAQALKRLSAHVSSRIYGDIKKL
ncbi:MAG: alpha/beta hydrolase [Lachnospiraceae bacterium]|nr:alpha/beta hydrolase [Lachnospiraceae bacterium]